MNPHSTFRRALLAALALPACLIAQTPAPDPATKAPADPAAEKLLQEALSLKLDRTAASILKAQKALAEPKLPDNPVELFHLRAVAGQWKEAAAFFAQLPAGKKTS